MTLTIERPLDSPGVVRLVIDNPPVNATGIADLMSMTEQLCSLSRDDRVVLII